MELEVNVGAPHLRGGLLVVAEYSPGDSSEPEDNTTETLGDSVDDGLGYDDEDEENSRVLRGLCSHGNAGSS